MELKWHDLWASRLGLQPRKYGNRSNDWYYLIDRIIDGIAQKCYLLVQLRALLIYRLPRMLGGLLWRNIDYCTRRDFMHGPWHGGFSYGTYYMYETRTMRDPKTWFWMNGRRSTRGDKGDDIAMVTVGDPKVREPTRAAFAVVKKDR